jgi:hypothetical protein
MLCKRGIAEDSQRDDLPCGLPVDPSRKVDRPQTAFSQLLIDQEGAKA